MRASSVFFAELYKGFHIIRQIFAFMVNDIQIVRVISDCLQKYSPAYVVYDPVMVSTSGKKLMTDEAIEEIKKELEEVEEAIRKTEESEFLVSKNKVTIKEKYKTKAEEIKEQRNKLERNHSG